MGLTVSVGQASHIGRRERNEDHCAIAAPSPEDLETKGLLAAIADGVGGGDRGSEAAQSVIHGLLNDYYATPDTWSVQRTIDTIVNALNRWLIAQSPGNSNGKAMATTLSALVMRGCRYYVAHVGDSRIYLLRDGALKQLTTDHVWNHPDLRHVLTRGVGLDPHLVLDYASNELMMGDTFLLVSDGVWEPLGESNILKCLSSESEPANTASQLIRAALDAGGRDNATAIVIRVDKLAGENLRDTIARNEELHLPKRLRPGEHIDGFVVEQLLHESRVTILYKAKRTDNARSVVIKTLKPDLADDERAISGLLTEEWLLRRLSPELFPQVEQSTSEPRSAIYYAMTWHEGATLEAQLDSGKKFSALEVQEIGIRLLKGLAALHRRDILHRDIKPANLHEGLDGHLRILDLGLARFGAEPDGQLNRAGTPSYMAPELHIDKPANVSTDLYAAGVTLYHLLTRHYPYGEIEPFQTPKFNDPIPPSRYRPDIPSWLEALLFKAVARDPKNRFETAEEFLLFLERGEKSSLNPRRHTPLADRLPLHFWQIAASLSLAANLLLLLLLLTS
ncbi:MAG TPA: bifunctional protein-serine/threonine kinase/phosphatase [Burkholderiales bacterium]|nr:bifunctional protein-serine/threonine kinase/phosphatase [Burkholderiales bacterium]